MNFSLSYHRKKVGISIPLKNIASVISPPKLSPLQDLPQAIARVLDRPKEQHSLDTILQSGDKSVIIVSDLTRYTGAHLFLPHLINRMNKKGIPDNHIAIVFALGIHRPMTLEEQIRIVGKEVASRVHLENHDPKNQDQLVFLGKTRQETPVVINRRVAGADNLVLTGTIGYHYLAGFGGGRKCIIPGVSSFETCVAVHLRVLNPDRGGRHPLA